MGAALGAFAPLEACLNPGARALSPLGDGQIHLPEMGLVVDDEQPTDDDDRVEHRVQRIQNDKNDSAVDMNASVDLERRRPF